jgi:hypothetical protein
MAIITKRRRNYDSEVFSQDIATEIEAIEGHLNRDMLYIIPVRPRLIHLVARYPELETADYVAFLRNCAVPLTQEELRRLCFISA